MSRDGKVGVLESLTAGSVAGLADAFFTFPLDLIKTRFQASNKYKGVTDAFKIIVKNEGALSLYKGFGPVATAMVPKVGIRFCSFEFFNNLFRDKEKKQMIWGGSFIAGLLAGGVESVLIVAPVELIKVRLQLQGKLEGESKYKNQFHAFRTILRGPFLHLIYFLVTIICFIWLCEKRGRCERTLHWHSSHNYSSECSKCNQIWSFLRDKKVDAQKWCKNSKNVFEFFTKQFKPKKGRKS